MSFKDMVAADNHTKDHDNHKQTKPNCCGITCVLVLEVQVIDQG